MSSRRADSPPAKRVKLGSRSSSRSPSIQEISPPRIETEKLDGDADTVDEEHCSICLQPFVDRTVVPACSHEFCFECLLIWTGAYCCSCGGFLKICDIVLDMSLFDLQTSHGNARCARKPSGITSFTIYARSLTTRNITLRLCVPLLVLTALLSRPSGMREDALGLGGSMSGADDSAKLERKQTCSNLPSKNDGGSTGTTSLQRYAAVIYMSEAICSRICGST